MTADIYWWGPIDRDPDQTKRKVLAALASSPGGAPMRRRAIQGVVFGDRYGAHQTIDALRILEAARLVDRSPYDSRKWRITAAGRVALDLADIVETGAQLDLERATEEFVLRNREDMDAWPS